MALFTVTVQEKENLPPSQVGNNTVSTNYGEAYVFTVADFTTNTSPAYSDPEGDSAFQLKIITNLPSQGTLELNGTPVTLNQVISFSDIASGLLTYVPDDSDVTAYSIDFEFEIADSGSGQFVG